MNKLIASRHLFHSVEQYKHVYKEAAQEHLPKLSEPQEQLLLSAGVNIDNYEQKSAEALEQGDKVLAKAIGGKYLLPNEWDDRPDEYYFQLFEE